MSVCFCSTGSLAGLCEDKSMKAEWREEPVRQLALGSVTLPALMDRAVNTLNDNQMLMRCSGREAEERAGILRLEL